MSFSLDLSRAIEKAKGKQETVIKKVILELFSKVVMKSPVGNPENWAINATAKEYNNAVKEYNSSLRQYSNNLTKNGRLKRGLKSHDSMSIAHKGYVGGRFRANWIVSLSAPDKSTTTETDKGGRNTIGRIESDLNKMTINGHTVFLTNSLGYSIRLEHGWSKQSPQGMVKLSLMEISSRYGR